MALLLRHGHWPPAQWWAELQLSGLDEALRAKVGKVEAYADSSSSDEEQENGRRRAKQASLTAAKTSSSTGSPKSAQAALSPGGSSIRKKLHRMGLTQAYMKSSLLATATNCEEEEDGGEEGIHYEELNMLIEPQSNRFPKSSGTFLLNQKLDRMLSRAKGEEKVLFFKCLGTGLNVPKFLRANGKVKNKNMSKRDTEKLVWAIYRVM